MRSVAEVYHVPCAFSADRQTETDRQTNRQNENEKTELNDLAIKCRQSNSVSVLFSLLLLMLMFKEGSFLFVCSTNNEVSNQSHSLTHL